MLRRRPTKKGHVFYLFMAMYIFFVIIHSMIKKLLKEKWMWLLYLVLFSIFVGQRIYSFFWPKNPEYFYHQILMIFSVNQDLWPFPYLSTISSLILSIFTIGFLWFYTLNKKFFSAAFISVITIARLISDIGGYSYEWNTIQALFYQSAITSHLAAINLILWILPSYLAMGDYIVKKLNLRGSKRKIKNPAQDASSQRKLSIKFYFLAL